MKTQQTKQTVAEFAIGLMVCGAVHLFLIAPAQERAHKVQTEADALSQLQGAGPSLNIDQLHSLAESARTTAARVDKASAPAKNETELFGRIMSLAEASGVRVDSLQPTGEAGSSGKHVAGGPAATGVVAPPLPPGNPGAPPPPSDISVGYAMVVSAPFAKVVEFVRRLPTGIGFAVVRTVKIDSGDSQTPGTVRAHIETEHFAFDTASLASLSESPSRTTAAATEGK